MPHNEKGNTATVLPFVFNVDSQADPDIIARGPIKVNNDLSGQVSLCLSMGFQPVPAKYDTDTKRLAPVVSFGATNYRFRRLTESATHIGIKLNRVVLVDWDGYKPGAPTRKEMDQLTDGMHLFQEHPGKDSIHWLGLLPDYVKASDLLQAYNGTIRSGVDIKLGNQLAYLKEGKIIHPMHVSDLPEVSADLLAELFTYSHAKRDEKPSHTATKKPVEHKEPAVDIDPAIIPTEWKVTRDELAAAGDPSSIWLGITKDIVKAGHDFGFYAALQQHCPYLSEKPYSWLERTWNNAFSTVEKDKADAVVFDLKLPEKPELAEYQPQYTGRIPIIEGLFTFSSTWMLVAASGTGKTFFTLGTMALASLGQSFGDRCSIPCHNFYFGAEGLSRLPVRIRALEAMYNDGNPIERLHIRNPFDFALNTPEGWIELQNYLIEQSNGEPIGIVAFDTLMAVGAALTPKFDVNNPTSMQLISNRLSTLANNLGCSAGVIHHPGKTDKAGLDSYGNGNDAIKNGAELFWTMRETARNGDSKLISIKQHKDRDGALNNFSFELAAVELDDQRTEKERDEDKRALASRGAVKTKMFTSGFAGLKHSSKPVINPNKTLFLVPEVYEFIEKVDAKLDSSATHKGSDESGRNESQPAKLKRFVEEAGADGRTVDEVKEFLESIGVNIKNLSNITKRAYLSRDGDTYRVDKSLFN